MRSRVVVGSITFRSFVNEGATLQSGLTELEQTLLAYFREHADEDLSRDQLLSDVWGYADGVSSRTVDVFVGKLRRKLEPDPTSPTLIVTVRGVGYRYVLEEQTPTDGPPPDALPLIGRDEELESLDAWSRSDRRLLTLTGPLGVGKSRLARAFARRSEAAYIDLLADPGAQWPDGLVVLDHVDLAGPAARRLVRDRLWSTTHRIVATSRGPLGFQSEEVLRLHPLDPAAARALADTIHERAGTAATSGELPRLPFLTIRAALGRDAEDARPRHRNAQSALASMELDPELLEAASRLSGLQDIENAGCRAIGIDADTVMALESAGALWRYGDRVFISALLDHLSAPIEARRTLADWVLGTIRERASAVGIPYLGLSRGTLYAAMQGATDDEQRGWLLVALYDSYDPPDASAPLDEALSWEVSDELADRLDEVRLQYHLFASHLDWVEEALQTAAPRTTVGHALLDNLRARFFLRIGQPEQAIVAVQSAISLGRKAGDRFVTSVCYNTLATARIRIGQRDAAVQALRVALALMRGDAAAAMSANLGSLLMMRRDDMPAAREVLQNAPSMTGAGAGPFMFHDATGVLCVLDGDLDAAEAAFRMASVTPVAHASDRWETRLSLAIVEHLRGNVVEAMRTYHDLQVGRVERDSALAIVGWWEAIAWGDLGLPEEGLDRLDRLTGLAVDDLLQAGRRWLRGEEVHGPEQCIETVRQLIAIRGHRRTVE